MDLETRRKISKTMKGKSNFEGHKHTHATKIQIGISQEGHRNAKDHKWVTDKKSGEEHRVKGHIPGTMRKGRSRRFQEWIHTKEEKQVWEKPSPVVKSEKLSPDAKARAKARAKAAGRPYPNMVDNIWAARNEEKSIDLVRRLIKEAKATYCGRCGTVHVPPSKGGTCPALKKK